jgi:hypothetical protein
MKNAIVMLLALLTTGTPLFGEVIDLRRFWDSSLILRNPDKGWYHHYYDNGIDKYLTKEDSDLEDIPGLDHLYLRLAWSFLEPEEGKYDWEVIDKVIDKWVANGYGISFRISCRETGLRYATPEWLVKKGLPGKYITNWGKETFEPDYGHKLFLEHLEKFHNAFARRYDGKEWLRYVDIGSYGEWGEGHTSFGSKKPWPLKTIKKHINIHTKAYTKTQIVASDDLLHHRPDTEADKLRKYINERGIAWRDDSPLVKFYVDEFPETHSVSHPQVFKDSWESRPTILEMQHYQMIIDDGNWVGTDGSQRGADILIGACETIRPTWVGFHGYADQWLKDNPNLTGELLNRIGYWFFPVSLELPDFVTAGELVSGTLIVENRGWAPAYQEYSFILRLEGPGAFERVLKTVDSRQWMPVEKTRQDFEFKLPERLSPGEYKIKIRLADGPSTRTILLGLTDRIIDYDGFYEVGTLELR